MKSQIFTALLSVAILSSCSLNSEKNTAKKETETLQNEIKVVATDKLPGQPIDVAVEADKFVSNTNKHSKKLCTGESYRVEAEVKKVNFEQFIPNLQQFTINPKIEQVITTATGNKLIIPAYSFPANAPVQLNIREYYGKECAFTQGLTTQTNDGKILESAGMFYIDAYTNGKKTELRPGAEIVLETALAVDENMGLYYGQRQDDGNVYWDFDPLGTTPSPVVVMLMGSHKKAAGRAFSDQYKFDKAAMIKMIGKQWKTSASFDRDGVLIGTTLCSNNKQPEDIACNAFFSLIPTMKKEIFSGNFQRWAAEFVFTIMSREQFAAERTANSVISEMDKAVAKFKPEGDGRKYFSIGSLGFINIDMEIPLPALTAKTDLIVKAETALDEIKLIFTKRNTVLSPKFENGYYIFKNIPVGTEVKIIGSYSKGDKIFIASKDTEIKKSNMPINLEYMPCAEKDLAAKLAALGI